MLVPAFPLDVSLTLTTHSIVDVLDQEKKVADFSFFFNVLS